MPCKLPAALIRVGKVFADEHGSEDQIIDGKDAEDPPAVEGTCPVYGGFGVDQDAGDQEARQHKEQIHPPGSKLRNRQKPAGEWAVGHEYISYVVH